MTDTSTEWVHEMAVAQRACGHDGMAAMLDQLAVERDRAREAACGPADLLPGLAMMADDLNAAEGENNGLSVEVDRLSAWKHSAMAVLAEWDDVWEAAGKPGPLGTSKAESTRTRIERLNDVIAALDLEVERLQSELVDARADLSREIGRSHGMARWGCPHCPPGDDLEVLGDLTLVCIRCGTRYYDGEEDR